MLLRTETKHIYCNTFNTCIFEHYSNHNFKITYKELYTLRTNVTLEKKCFMQQSVLYGVFDDSFSYFSSKPYVMTPYLNRLVETVAVEMKVHNIRFFKN